MNATFIPFELHLPLSLPTIEGNVDYLCHGRDGTRSKAVIRNSIFFSPVFFSRFL